jgi:hypothetical protein
LPSSTTWTLPAYRMRPQYVAIDAAVSSRLITPTFAVRTQNRHARNAIRFLVPSIAISLKGMESGYERMTVLRPTRMKMGDAASYLSARASWPDVRRFCHQIKTDGVFGTHTVFVEVLD